MTYSYSTQTFTIYAWDLATVSATGNLFPDASGGNIAAVGSSFTLANSSSLTEIKLTDNDYRFNDGDSSQLTKASVTLDGDSFAAGQITPEYAYVVRPAGSTDPADNITVYAISMNGAVIGFVSDEPMQPGQTYDVLSLTTNCPSVCYSDLATTALDPMLDGIVEGTAGDDLIDYAYTGDPDGDRIDHNDAILPGEAPQDDIVRAGAGNDTVHAGEGDDDVEGDDGNDVLYGDAGDDRLAGGAGNDTLSGGAGNDTILAGDGFDVVYAGGGDDLVVAGPGDDTVFAGSGDDTVEGGSGNDIIWGDNAGQAADCGCTDHFPTWAQDISNVVFYFDTNGDGEIDYSVKVDGFPSSGHGDWIGNDLDVYYEQMRDYVIANDANLSAADPVIGVSIKGGIQTTSFFRVEGDENCAEPDLGPTDNTGPHADASLQYHDFAQSYDPTLPPGTQTPAPDGDDLLAGGDGDDTIHGEGGNDTIIGGEGADSMTGGDDRDTFVVASAVAGAGDQIDGGEGGDDHDVLDLTGAGPLNILYDPLNPENGTVQFFDAEGNVTGTLAFQNIENIIFDQGDGIVEGTAGADLIDFAYTGDPEGDMIDHNDALLPGEAPQDDIVLAGDGNDTVVAGEGDDEVYGEDGDDLLYGGSGDDYISGGNGDDTLYGGDGNDTLDAGQDGDMLFGEAGNDLLKGGPREDYMDGGSGADTLEGGNAADTMLGGSGNDRLYGNDGDDEIFGGNGSDYADGGLGNDYVNTANGGALPLPDLGYPGLFPADANPLNDRDTVFGGAGNDTIITGDDADWIDGGSGDDVIDAGFDSDTVFGGEGKDFIVGGEGSDSIDGGAGDDTIYGGLDPIFPDSLNIPDATDLVPENGRDTISGGDGDDVIFGQDDDDLIRGDAGDDFIDGGIDEDTIHGGTGNDTIIGGEGADSMAGGDDRDTFLVGTNNAGLGDVIDGNEGGDDHDTLNLTGAGPLRVVYDAGNPENGIVQFLDGVGGPVKGTLSFTNIENVIPCFTPGTLLATPKGERAVEELRAGDRVITRDNGIQEIRWVGRRALNRAELAAAPHLKPVLIRAGSLGNGLPERDMLVSPNHRMLVSNDRTALYFEEHEVLVAAKHLVDHKGVKQVEMLGTTYLHFMFGRHEVVLANGAWTESFQPGDYTLGGMGNAQRSEIFELFPELRTREGLENYTSARRTLRRYEVALLGR